MIFARWCSILQSCRRLTPSQRRGLWNGCAPPGISSGDPPRLRQYIRQRLAEPFSAEISHQERECGAIAVGSTLRGPRSIHGSERHVRYQQVTPAKVGPGLRSFVYPLRMAAFLSAAGVKAEPELERFANRF
jgi:hypothetical protein